MAAGPTCSSMCRPSWRPSKSPRWRWASRATASLSGGHPHFQQARRPDMQASQVKLDGVYGINVRGTLVGLRVTEIITVKTGSGSSNYVSGPFEWTDGTRHMAEKKPVKDLIDDFETLKKLEKERAERE